MNGVRCEYSWVLVLAAAMEMKEVYRTIDAWTPASSATGVCLRVCVQPVDDDHHHRRVRSLAHQHSTLDVYSFAAADRPRPLDFRERATRRGSQTHRARGTPRVDSTTRLAIRGDEEGAREARRTRSRVSFSERHSSPSRATLPPPPERAFRSSPPTMCPPSALDFELSGQGETVAGAFALKDVQQAAVDAGFVKSDVGPEKPLAQRVDLAAFFKTLGVSSLSGFKQRFYAEKLPKPHPGMTPLVHEKVPPRAVSPPLPAVPRIHSRPSRPTRPTEPDPHPPPDRTSPRRRRSRGPCPPCPSTRPSRRSGRRRSGACSPSPAAR